MSSENERRRLVGANEPAIYGAVMPDSTFGEEITPLLEEMDDTKIGVSQQTLVSNTGGYGTPKRGMQFLAAISVTLGAFGLGNVLGWTSPANSAWDAADDEPFSTEEKSWIGATMALGAAFVVYPIGAAMDIFGRKKAMLGLALPFTAAWLLIAFGKDKLWMFIVGRFVTGMMGGAFSLTAPTYTSEIADDGVRGMLGSFFQLLVTIGILFTYILGGAKVDVPVIGYVCAAIPLLFAGLFMFMPETPAYLLKKGDEDGARKSLSKFRGGSSNGYALDDELRAQKEAIERSQAEKLSCMEAFSTTAAKRGLFIAVGLMVFQQLSGINAVIFYSSDIFKAAGSTLDKDISTIIVGAVQVAATLVSTLVVDKLGRRILLLLSDFVMAVCCILLAVFFFIQENDLEKAGDIGWLPLMSLCLFIVMFSLGYGPIPWLIMGELFPQNIKAPAASIACVTNWLLCFLVTKFFSNLTSAIHEGPTFLIFAGVSLVGTAFVFFFVPETKGKSLTEIQNELSGNKKTNTEVPEKY